MNRYYSLAAYFRQRFGRRLRKVPLDAGSSCPNRNGPASRQGCVFCNAGGSGTGLASAGLPLSAQWERFTARARPDKAGPDRTDRTDRTNPNGAGPPAFMAYLQSFSNTYGPAARLAGLLDELRSLPGLAALGVGTRPDCLDREKLDLLAAAGIPETWLELGLQSASDATLARIGRGHDFACFARTVEQAAALGLKVCTHVMAGLPGEGEREFLTTVRAVSSLPAHGIKFHNCLVLRETTLEAMWKANRYSPLTPESYVAMLCQALAETRPDMVVHRLQTDPGPDELVAPAWAGDKQAVLALIRAELRRLELWQGQALGARLVPPWFDPDQDLPPSLQ